MPLRRLLIVCACLAVLPSAVSACPDHVAKAAVMAKPRPASAAALVAWKPRAWAPPAAVAAAGLMISIDPVDGTYSMPAPDELAASSTLGEEDRRPVSVFRRANGSVRAQLDERWASHSVASIGPDGKLRWTCVDGKKKAEQFMQNPVIPAAAQAAPQWEEK